MKDLAVLGVRRGSILLVAGLATFVDAFSLPLFSTSLSQQSKSTVPKALTLPEIQAIQLEKERVARELHDNDVWNALFVSVPEQAEPTPCTVSSLGQELYGERCKPYLPHDFPPGCLLRIGPNGGSQDDGFLDGDGMIQCITFPPPDLNGKEQADSTTSTRSMFSATYVQTAGRTREIAKVAEIKNGEDTSTTATPPPTYKGSLGAAPRGLPILQNMVWNMWTFRTLVGQKDTANTALAEHGGRVLALMEQSPPTEIEITKDGRIRTVEAMTRLNGAVPNAALTGGSLAAHGRTCTETGDRIHVSYQSNAAPFARVDIFGQEKGGWTMKQSIPVDIPVPAMVHDCAITNNYALVLDFPLTVRPMRLMSDKFPVAYEPENGARIGLVPRRSPGKTATVDEDILWFDVEPGVILHAANAYETNDGTQVVLHALRSEPRADRSFITDYTTAFLHEWTLDLKTGRSSERCLNPNVLVDFPVLDDRCAGKQADAVYCSLVSAIGGPMKIYKAPEEGILLAGVVKFALEDNEASGVTKGDVLGTFSLPDTWYAVSEPTVVAKQRGSDEERGGVYILLIATQVTDEALSQYSWERHEDLALRSQMLIFDGNDLDAGPVYALDLPYHVPYGLHSSFLEWDKMK